MRQVIGLWKVIAFVALVPLACGATVLAATGCGGGTAKAKTAPGEGVRSTVIEHEPCDASGKVESLDANNDGKPDVRRVFDGAREICRITDLNHDGRPDMYEYFDAAGQIRRREADYDDNGIMNAIEHFENGKLVLRELDTTNRGKIDTWDFFDPQTGARTKRERDATGDGQVDQWWTYDGDKVTIAMDRNGDGLPEPESTIVLGGGGVPIVDAGVASSDGGVPAASGDASTAPPPPPPPPDPSPSPKKGDKPTQPSLSVSDAGVPGKPQRGGAKR